MNWRKGQESNLQATSAVVFGTTALPVRLPFRETDEGREIQSREHTSRHTSPVMANSRTLAKHRVHHPSKAPCLHPAKSISIVKKQKERALSFSVKLPAPSILLNLFEIGSGRPLPLYYCLILTNRFMTADCCRRIDCSLFVLLVSIEVSSFTNCFV